MKLANNNPWTSPKIPKFFGVSPDVAYKLEELGDEEVLALPNISIRVWDGSEEIRYALIRLKGTDNYRLSLADDDYDGKTYVLDRSSQVSKKSSGVRLKTVGKVLALLTLSATLGLLTLGKKNSGQDKKSASEEKIVSKSAEKQLPKTVQEILSLNYITIDDLILNNPELLSVFSGMSWGDISKVEISPEKSLNTQAFTQISEYGNPIDATLFTGKTLEEISQNSTVGGYLDGYHTMLENMIASECAQKNGEIPKDIIGGSDVHGGEQYAGVNMKSAKDSHNPDKLKHAEEIAACYASGNQKKLRELVKTYYLIYYFPSIQSYHPAISAFLLDTSMNRGAHSIEPICKMVMNRLMDRKYGFSLGEKETVDTEGNKFIQQKWDTQWLPEHQKAWDVLCLREPEEVLKFLRNFREKYEDETLGPRPGVRQALINRWDNCHTAAREFLLPATYRNISYFDSVALIEQSLVSGAPTHDSFGKPIIYRVQRIANPTEKQLPGEQKYEKTVNIPRPEKRMLLFHGTASGIVGKDDEYKRDMGGFNAIYGSSDAAFVVTGKGLIFMFFDPTKGHGAANATHIANSTGIPKEVVNFNNGCVAVELCLRGYKGGELEKSPDAIYGVERPNTAQKKSCRELALYLRETMHIKYVGTSADPVRDHTKCYASDGKVLFGEEFLVPKAHCDDFSTEVRKDMGIMPAEEMAKIFSSQKELSRIFNFQFPEVNKVTGQ